MEYNMSMTMINEPVDTEISCEEFYGDPVEITEEDWAEFDDVDINDVARFFGYEPEELFDETGGLTAEAYELLVTMEGEGAFAS